MTDYIKSFYFLGMNLFSYVFIRNQFKNLLLIILLHLLDVLVGQLKSDEVYILINLYKYLAIFFIELVFSVKFQGIPYALYSTISDGVKTLICKQISILQLFDVQNIKIMSENLDYRKHFYLFIKALDGTSERLPRELTQVKEVSRSLWHKHVSAKTKGYFRVMAHAVTSSSNLNVTYVSRDPPSAVSTTLIGGHVWTPCLLAFSQLRLLSPHFSLIVIFFFR